MSRPLLASRRFAPIFWCQFLSALNDNFVKNALVILILYRIGGENAPTLVTLAGTALILPFFFLSALGGELADKFDKAQMARWIKLAEIPIAGIAAAGFIYSSVELLFLSLFLFGSAAALFGPIKYGILPDHLETRELPAANALVEGATFLAILIGTITGGLAVAGHGDTMLVPPSVLAIIMLTLAGFGWLSARFIMPTGRAAPDLRISVNPLSSTFRLLRELRADRRLWVGGLITSWFWLAGIVALSLLPSLIKTQIGGSEDVVTLTLVVFTIGIASGSWMAARASRHRPNLALVPIGALAMGLSAIAVAVLVTRFGHGTTPVTPATLIAMPSGLALLVALFALSASGVCSSCHRSRRSNPGRRRSGVRASSPQSTCSMPCSWLPARWSPLVCRYLTPAFQNCSACLALPILSLPCSCSERGGVMGSKIWPHLCLASAIAWR